MISNRRVSQVVLILCGLSLGGAASSAAEVPASELGGPPQTPITGPAGGVCPPAAVAERVELCGTLNPQASAKTSYRWDYNSGTSCRGGTETDTWEEVEGRAIEEDLEVPYLLPGTYTYCLVAWDQYGETVGQPVSFATAGECPALWVHSGEEGQATPWSPSLGTAEPTSPPEKARTMLGTIHLACGGVVSYYFEYGLSTQYGSSTPAVQVTIPGRTEPHEQAYLPQLAPSTTYDYRLLVIDDGNTAAGGEAELTTPSGSESGPPVGLTPSPEGAPAGREDTSPSLAHAEPQVPARSGAAGNAKRRHACRARHKKASLCRRRGAEVSRANRERRR